MGVTREEAMYWTSEERSPIYWSGGGADMADMADMADVRLCLRLPAAIGLRPTPCRCQHSQRCSVRGLRVLIAAGSPTQDSAALGYLVQQTIVRRINESARYDLMNTELVLTVRECTADIAASSYRYRWTIVRP